MVLFSKDTGYWLEITPNLFCGKSLPEDPIKQKSVTRWGHWPRQHAQRDGKRSNEKFWWSIPRVGVVGGNI